MKILIPSFAVPDSFADNVACSLREMGHEVMTRQPRGNKWVNSRFVRFRRQAIQHYFPGRFTDSEKWLLKNAAKFRPELVLTLTQPIAEEVLAETRRIGVANRVVWWGDTPANMKQMGLLSTEWDWIYLKDPIGVEKFERLGFNCHLMHEAMNPSWHKPVAKQANEQVVVAGSFYGYRQAIVTRLIDANISMGLYGGRLPRWCDPRIAAMHTRKFVVKEEKSRVFGEGLACLNSTSLTEFNSLNCRAFEIAGCGGLQLLENREIVSQCFDPGKELLVFDSMEELLGLIGRAKVDKHWAQTIRDAGAYRARSEHTYKHRLQRMLSNLDTLGC